MTSPQLQLPDDLPEAGGPGARKFAVLGLVLLVPITVVAVIMALSTEDATQCLMYGDVDGDGGCSGVSYGVIRNLFIASGVVGVVGAIWPTTWRRYARTWWGVVAAQWGAQLVMAVAILSYAA